jgi:hypothetical protein
MNRHHDQRFNGATNEVSWKASNRPNMDGTLDLAAKACRQRPTVDDDRSKRDTGTVDARGPRSQATLGPTDR